MIKIWIVILTTAIPASVEPPLPGVDSLTQEFRVFDEAACRAMETEPTILEGGLYWSARCEPRLIPKPKETK